MTFVLSSNLNSARGFMLNFWIPLPDPHDTSLSAWDRVGITASYPSDHCSPLHPALTLRDAAANLVSCNVRYFMVFAKRIQARDHRYSLLFTGTMQTLHCLGVSFHTPDYFSNTTSACCLNLS